MEVCLYLLQEIRLDVILAELLFLFHCDKMYLF